MTGSIIGCLGRADINGIFFVEDFVYAEYVTEPNCPSGDLTAGTKKSLFDREALADPNRSLVALVSGLELGLPQD